ncbi:MAG: c-type cytochrome [Ferruginibacter sp.]
MKKYSLILAVSLFFIACGGNDSGSADKKETPKATPPVTENPDYQKGLNLIAKSDCFTCHKLREAATGPAYGDVAKKYDNTEANQTMLADKVIKGGQGVWGEIPMAAHPNLSKEDAVQMVKYILLLREEKK